MNLSDIEKSHELVQNIDYKKRNWSRDLGINFFGLMTALVLVVAFVSDLVGIDWWYLLVAAIVIFPLHELSHGLAFTSFGGKVNYGAGWTKFGPVFYAASPGHLFSRAQMLVIAFAPQVLSLLLIAVGELFTSGTLRSFLVLGAILNISGGAGDFYASMQMLKYSRELLVEDSAMGMNFYMPKP